MALLFFNELADGSRTYKEVIIKVEKALSVCHDKLEDHSREFSIHLDIILIKKVVDHLQLLAQVESDCHQLFFNLINWWRRSK